MSGMEDNVGPYFLQAIPNRHIAMLDLVEDRACMHKNPEIDRVKLFLKWHILWKTAFSIVIQCGRDLEIKQIKSKIHIRI